LVTALIALNIDTFGIDQSHNRMEDITMKTSLNRMEDNAMNTSLKRRAGLIGVALALSALLLVVSIGATNAQGLGPQHGWGNCFSSPNGYTGTLPYGYTGTLSYDYDCGMLDGWHYGWLGYGFNPQTNVTRTFPYGYGMMDGWMMGDWPGYGYNRQNNVPNATPNGSNPQNGIPNTTPNGYNSNRGGWGHGMTGGQGRGMMGGWHSH
jgi:hypothetical protein